MMTRGLLVALAAGATLLAACGSSSNGSSATTAAAATPTTAAAAAAPTTAAAATEAPATAAPGASTAASGAAPVVVAKSKLGDILTAANGMTLYAFTKDTAGTPTCTGGCATAWPPVTIPTAKLPAGLDAKVFSVAEGPNETYQLAAGKWPLYTYSGDSAAGDTNGQGVNGFFVVAPDGSLIKG